MKLNAVFGMLTWATRIGGIFQFDRRGRPTVWYAVTILHMGLIILGHIIFWAGSAKYKELMSRPFSFLIRMIEMYAILASYACYAIQRRALINLEKLEAFEKQNKFEINYGEKWMILHVYVIPAFHIVKYAILFSIYGWKRSPPTILGRVFPKLLTQLGEVYYCCVLRILHKQLQVLSTSKLNWLQRMIWHSYLVELCNSMHKQFKYHLIFGILTMITGSIRCEMQVTEGYLTCLSVGGKFCSYFLFAVLIIEILDITWQLYCVNATCYRVRIQAADCFRNDIELQMMQNRPKLDVRLLVYAARIPEFNTNVEDFFDPSPTLFLKITAQSVIFYALMLQLKVIRPWMIDG